MLTNREKCGVYQCIEGFIEPYYSYIVRGFIYIANFVEGDSGVEVEDCTYNYYFYIPAQDFLDHFQKVIKDENLNRKEVFE